MEDIEWPDQIEEQKEIQEETAKLVFTPEFIHYYLDIKKEFNLSHSATLVYGFIRYYLKSASSKFYFTNTQLAEMLSVTETWISEAVSELKKKELIHVNYKMKGGGGKVRFVTWVYGRQLREKPNFKFGKNRSGDEATTSVKAEDNKNINNNNIKEKIFEDGDLDPLEERRRAREYRQSRKGKGLGGYTQPQASYPKFEKKVKKHLILEDVR